MKPKLLCGALAVIGAAWLCLAAAAWAASSPTLTIKAASAVTASSAVLNGTVDPNGSATSYHFNAGPTTALGSASATKSAGAGTKALSVSYDVTGLQSGTTYYYNLQAANVDGTVSTKTISFKTTGPAPAQATTGGATVLSSSSATLTGVVEPEGADTTYYFEIGLNNNGTYMFDTTPETVTTGTNPVPVQVTVSGLEAGTTFYYALVATHGGINTGAGSAQTFETFPDPVPVPKVTQHTSPKVEKGKPFVFLTAGEVENHTTTPDSLACTGTATVSFYYGHRLVARQATTLTPTCGFSATTTFAHYPVPKKGPEQLLVYVRFNGNGYLGRSILKPATVTVG